MQGRVGGGSRGGEERWPRRWLGHQLVQGLGGHANELRLNRAGGVGALENLNTWVWGVRWDSVLSPDPVALPAVRTLVSHRTFRI